MAFPTSIHLVGVALWFQALTALVLERQDFDFEPGLWPTFTEEPIKFTVLLGQTVSEILADFSMTKQTGWTDGWMD